MGLKADAKQDYYGDLGLPVSADHEDIKKQFRLLGTCKSSPAALLLIPRRSQAVSPRSQFGPRGGGSRQVPGHSSRVRDSQRPDREEKI